MCCLYIAMLIGQIEASASPVATICYVAGNPVIHRSDRIRIDAAMFTQLLDGEKIVTPKDSEAEVAFADGTVQRIRAHQAVTITPHGCEPKSDVQSKVLKSNALREVTTTLRGIIRRGTAAAVTLRDPPAAAVAHEPFYEATVLTNKPTLQWQSVSGAVSYQILVRDLEAKRVIFETEAKKPQLEGWMTLEWGKDYSWKAIAISESGDVQLIVDSRFQTASCKDVQH